MCADFNNIWFLRVYILYLEENTASFEIKNDTEMNRQTNGQVNNNTLAEVIIQCILLLNLTMLNQTEWHVVL